MSAFAAPVAFAAAPPNDNFGSAQALAGANINIAGTTLEATAEAGEPDHDGVFYVDDDCLTAVTPDCGSSAWYTWTAPSTGTFQFQTCVNDYDTVLAVYTGTAVNALTPVVSNDDTACGDSGLGSVVSFPANMGQEFRIAVAGFIGDAGTFTLSTDAPPPFTGGGDPVVTPPAQFLAPPAQAQKPKKGKKKCGKKKGGKKGGKRATASKKKGKKCGKKKGGKKGGK